MIGLYGKYIFKGSVKIWSNEKIEFLGVWESSVQEFLKTYHFIYPNEKLQIYKHKYKPLSRFMKQNIVNFMKNDPWFIQNIRQEKLKNLLS